MNSPLIVTSSPHLHRQDDLSWIMWTVFLCLLPSGLIAGFLFGVYSLLIICVSVTTAILTEFLIQLFTKKPITISDGSAALTGLLLSYNLPPSPPLWIPIIGSFVAIAIGKQIFGGLGRNIFNPALVGRAFLMASWPNHMRSFIQPFSLDSISSATPLSLLKEGGFSQIQQIGVNYSDLFWGNRAGCIGEICVFALLVGAGYLLYRGYISWHIPFSFIFSLGILSWIFSSQGFLRGDIIFSILSGGVILGAFFMATDYVTSPLTYKGQIIFGVGCGIFTFIIRRWGGYPEGVSYAILIMNAFVPLIDRYIRPKVYGKKIV